MAFWKRPKYSNSEHISGCQRFGCNSKVQHKIVLFFVLSDRTVYPDCCGDYTILYMDKTHTTILYSINLKTKTKQRSQPIPPESFPMCMSINRTILY